MSGNVDGARGTGRDKGEDDVAVGRLCLGAGVEVGIDRVGREDDTDSKNKAAGTGGLLQVASYLTGLSGESTARVWDDGVSSASELMTATGGSWITGSLLFNDFPTVEHMVFGNDQLSGWLLDIDLATPDGLDLFSDKNQYFFGGLLWSVIAKANKWM